MAVPKVGRENHQLVTSIVRAKLPHRRHSFVTTLFNLPLARERTTLVPPIIRPGIWAAAPSRDQPVLLYQLVATQQDPPLPQQLPDQEFRVYGFNKSESHGSAQPCPFSEAGFIADLASVRVVVTNGGFTPIAEAVFLHKPTCAIPIPVWFEQWLNAPKVQQMGYGRHFDAIKADNLRAFLQGLSNFETALVG